jgi:hypothetical protein
LVYDVGPPSPIGRAHPTVIKKATGGGLGISEAGQASAVQKISVLQNGNEGKTGLSARCFCITGREQGAALERW